MNTATKLFLVGMLGLVLASTIYLTAASADNTTPPVLDQAGDQMHGMYQYMYQYMHGNHSGTGPMDGTGHQYQHGAHGDGDGGHGPYGNQTDCPNQ